MNIYVDADACPVQNETITIAGNFDIPVILVKSFSHFSHDELPPFVETVYVDHGADSADMEIMRRAQRNDIVITQDYGLASLLLGKGCHVIHHKGFLYTNKNIERLLATRHLSAKARRAGKRTKGPKPFTDEEREKFQQLLLKVVQSNI